jgi:hypothetical protein
MAPEATALTRAVATRFQKFYEMIRDKIQEQKFDS